MSGFAKPINISRKAKAAPDVAANAAKPKGSGRGRMLEIDGYRGIAAVLIVVVHAWMEGGQTGYHGAAGDIFRNFDAVVSLFFALSGLVTFLPMVRGALTGQAPDGRKLLMRRLYRILPLYYFIVLVVWSARYTGTGEGWLDLLRHLTFTQVYNKVHIFWLDGPSWYLADDMHYMLLLVLVGPPLVRLAAKRSTVAGRLATMSVLPLVLLAANLVYVTIVHSVLQVPFSSSYSYYNPLARVDSFALGLLLAVIMSAPGVLKTRPKMAYMLSAVGIGSIAAFGAIRFRSDFVGTYFFVLAGISSMFLLAGAAMLDSKQVLSRILRSKPLQTLAVLSFSIYLWHEPVMIQLVKWHILYFRNATAWPLATVGLIASATLVAWISFHLVEQPGARMQKLIADLRARQRAGKRQRSGPPPRWLPDLVLATPSGEPIALRELLKDRPALFAFEAAGERALAEQRFRLDSGEATGVFVTSGDRPGPAGTTVLVDEEGRLAAALNHPTALIEVTPEGYITATQAPADERESATGLVAAPALA